MPRIERPVRALLLACAVVLPAWSHELEADPTPGFVESWTGTSTNGWTGGSLIDNPGAGGVGGAADGFLRVRTNFPSRLGSFSSGPEYAGNWSLAGVTEIKVHLSDVGADEPLEIHFSIGRPDNLWQYDIGFSPPSGTWAEFTIDLTASADFTQTHGSGTFGDALSSVSHVHFRHDLAPYVLAPDAIQADVGIDQFSLLSDPTPVTRDTWARVKALYR